MNLWKCYHIHKRQLGSFPVLPLSHPVFCLSTQSQGKAKKSIFVSDFLRELLQIKYSLLYFPISLKEEFICGASASATFSNLYFSLVRTASILHLFLDLGVKRRRKWSSFWKHVGKAHQWRKGILSVCRFRFLREETFLHFDWAAEISSAFLGAIEHFQWL